MANNVQVVEINEGTKIEFEQSNCKITFGDDMISVRCDRYQKDWPVHLDICTDIDNNLVIGVGVGRYYVAQLDIPATEYTETEVEVDGETQIQREPIPIDMADVILTLWSLDALTPTE